MVLVCSLFKHLKVVVMRRRTFDWRDCTNIIQSYALTLHSDPVSDIPHYRSLAPSIHDLKSAVYLNLKSCAFKMILKWVRSQDAILTMAFCDFKIQELKKLNTVCYDVIKNRISVYSDKISTYLVNRFKLELISRFLEFQAAWSSSEWFMIIHQFWDFDHDV